jgi:hypothetical protein
LLFVRWCIPNTLRRKWLIWGTRFVCLNEMISCFIAYFNLTCRFYNKLEVIIESFELLSGHYNRVFKNDAISLEVSRSFFVLFVFLCFCFGISVSSFIHFLH